MARPLNRALTQRPSSRPDHRDDRTRSRSFAAGAAALAFAILGFVERTCACARRTARRHAGQFDFYVLALSWSPGFCQAGGGDEKGRDQCRTGAGHGFVVHGLWPQFERGFPTQCQPANVSPSRIAMETAREVFVEEGLARHQWRKHGTCSGLSRRSTSPRRRRRAQGDGAERRCARSPPEDDDGARRGAGVRRGEPGLRVGHDGRRLPRRGAAGGARVPEPGPARVRALRRGGPARLPRAHHHRAAGALRRLRPPALTRAAAAGTTADELPSCLPRRQFRGRAQARRARAHPRPSRRQGHALPRDRHARRDRRVRPRLGRGGEDAGMARGASAACSRRSCRKPPRTSSRPISR